MALNLPYGIRPINPLARIDERYGPYNSRAEALAATLGTRKIGLQVGIITNGKLEDYWFEENIYDSGLVKIAAFAGEFNSLQALVSANAGRKGAYAYVNTGETFRVYHWDTVSNEWKAGSSGDGGTGPGESNFAGYFPTEQELIDSNTGAPNKFAITGTADLFTVWNWDQYESKWIPSTSKLNPEQFEIGPDGIINIRQDILGDHELGNRVINAGTITVNSDTSASIAGAEWFHTNRRYSFSGNITLPNIPASPNSRFDIITYGNYSVPRVKSGTALENPPVPNPDPGDMLGHTLYRMSNGLSVPNPTVKTVFATQIVEGRHREYAPIWTQTLSRNQPYSFKISFIAWASEWVRFGDYPMNGILMVNFVTKTNATEIDPNRVSVVCMDIGVDNGDFVLKQEGADKAVLYARKKGYLGHMHFSYIEPTLQTIRPNSLVSNGAYGPLPATGAAYPSYNGRDHVPSTGLLLFDRNRAYGFGGTKVSGNLAFRADIADDGNPTRADTSVLLKVLHHSASTPIVEPPLRIELIHKSGKYQVNTDNYFLFICHKDDEGNVVSISYTISQKL